MSDTTLVLGASPNEERYSNKAVRKLLSHGHSVIAVGLRQGVIQGVPIVKEIPAQRAVDTVTMYMNAGNQRAWEERLLALRPRRVIFNPGAENPDFARKATMAGIECVEACTLVLLATGQF